MFSRSLIFGMLCSCIIFGCSKPPIKPEQIPQGDYQYMKEYMSWWIPREMKKENVKGLSIALVNDQHIVWAKGFGFADFYNRVSATPDTVYRVASVSKLLTATSVMQLSDQNKIDIDRPINTYLPEFSIKSRFLDAGPITPRNIMTHHSGLPSNLLKGLITKHPKSFSEIVPEIKNDYVAYPANYIFSYSNIGYSLLGSLIEKVSGKDFASYMKESLLDPIGMSHSYFSTTLEKSSLSARGYRNEDEVDEDHLRDVPAGGLNSTVMDLGKFIQMVLANGKASGTPIIRAETLIEMLRPQNKDVPLDRNFQMGLGWMLSSFGDIDVEGVGIVAHHSGATLVFSSQLIILPEYKLGVVVLSNSYSASSVVDKVASEAIKLGLEGKTGKLLPEKKKPVEFQGKISPDELHSFEGTYATQLGLANVTGNSGSLTAKINNRTFYLTPLNDGHVRLSYRLFGLIPIPLKYLDKLEFERKSISGYEILAAHYGGAELVVGEKIQPVPIPQSWLARIGCYSITNLGDEPLLFEKIQLRHYHEFLILEYRMPLFLEHHVRFAIKPLSDMEAVIYGLGSGKGETIRVIVDQGEERLLFSGFVLKKTYHLFP